MAKPPRVVRNLVPLRKAVAAFREAGDRVALVPTMGALHAGHEALIRQARSRADRVIVSIFVNPTQFGPNEDFGAYPRDFDADLAVLTDLQTDLVWAPGAEVMYPEGFSNRVVPEGPAKALLEDSFRPHFFGGVATVVAKLLIQTLPDFAMFGEKDYQQLKVVTRMVRDLDIPTRIVGVPTIREEDGLALSSRNVFLSPLQRKLATTLIEVLRDCAEKMRKGDSFGVLLEQGRAAINRAGFKLDYLEARHADTLDSISNLRQGPVRLLVAARLGKTRLIDNIAV